MSDRYAAVQIGNLYLTSNGTSTGVPCRCRVEHESAFASTHASNTTLALDFTPHTQIVSRAERGIPFAVLIDYCPETLLASLVTLFNAALAAQTTVRVRVTSLTSFDVQAIPQFQDGTLFTFESRSGGIAKTCRLNFISTAAGS